MHISTIYLIKEICVLEDIDHFVILQTLFLYSLLCSPQIYYFSIWLKHLFKKRSFRFIKCITFWTILCNMGQKLVSKRGLEASEIMASIYYTISPLLFIVVPQSALQRKQFWRNNSYLLKSSEVTSLVSSKSPGFVLEEVVALFPGYSNCQ